MVALWKNNKKMLKPFHDTKHKQKIKQLFSKIKAKFQLKAY
jgi:hypothetical protein